MYTFHFIYRARSEKKKILLALKKFFLSAQYKISVVRIPRSVSRRVFDASSPRDFKTGTTMWDVATMPLGCNERLRKKSINSRGSVNPHDCFGFSLKRYYWKNRSEICRVKINNSREARITITYSELSKWRKLGNDLQMGRDSERFFFRVV